MKILTHNGRFHADEVVACGILFTIYNTADINVEIIRSRDLSNLDQYDFVVDIGKQYDPNKGRFDHHQTECTEKWADDISIFLSSSGLVFKKYWKEFFEKLGFANPTIEEANTVYRKVFLAIDAHDNGQEIEEYYLKWVKYKYKYSDGIKMGQVLASMNEENVNTPEQDTKFRKTMYYALASLEPIISSIIKNMRKNNATIKMLAKIPIKNGILVLPPDGYVNYNILKKIDPKRQIYFTVYQRKEDEWGFSTIQQQKFKNRIDLIPEDKTKYQDLIFIHKNSFCGSAKTKETAIQVCQDSMNTYNRYKLKKNIMVSLTIITLFGIGMKRDCIGDCIGDYISKFMSF